jgi:hypothetical protein
LASAYVHPPRCSALISGQMFGRKPMGCILDDELIKDREYLVDIRTEPTYMLYGVFIVKRESGTRGEHMTGGVSGASGARII